MARPAHPTRREDIVAAAREEFMARGFDGARMEDIGRRAGISKAAVYLQFEGKEAVFRALISEVVSAHLPVLAMPALPESSAGEMLRTFIVSAFRIVTKPEVSFLPRLIVGEGHKFPELVRFYHDEAILRILGNIEGVIRLGMERGEFVCTDPRHACRTIAGGIILTALWLTVLVPVGAEPIEIGAAAKAHADTVLHGLLARKEG